MTSYKIFLGSFGKKLLSSQSIHFLKMNKVDPEFVDELKKQGSVDDCIFLPVRDRYRLNLTRDIRRLFNGGIGSNLLFIKETSVACPHCNKQLKLPGIRVISINNNDITVICQDVKASVNSTVQIG